VNTEFQKILENARKKSSENKKFLDKLKAKKPNDLDLLTNELHDEAFDQIDCLECANCCRTTGPLLLNKDIDRLAIELKLKPSIFTEKFVRIDEDNDYVFSNMPCPFLGSDNYCHVYDARPNACKEFPHTQQRNILQKLKITYQNTLICPAVVLVVDGLKEKYKL
jgi:Fe-S-cluster containining protein